jgi:hypothetical protein
MIKDGIESEVEFTKFQSNECFEENVLFCLEFCVFVEIFDSFRTLKIEYFDVILLIKSIFAQIMRNLKYLKELQKLKKFKNLQKIWNFDFNSILKKERKITKIERDCFVKRINLTNYEMFYFYVFDLMNCNFSNVESPLFCEMVLFTLLNEVKRVEESESEIVRNEIDFVDIIDRNDFKGSRLLKEI